MSIKTFQDILPLIEQPSRYLGSEINTIKKDPGKIKLNFALVFPDLYEIGTSHFGLQILYSILNKKKRNVRRKGFCTRCRYGGAPEVSGYSHYVFGNKKTFTEV